MFLSFSFLFLLFAKARQGLQLLEILNSKQCLLHMEKKAIRYFNYRNQAGN